MPALSGRQVSVERSAVNLMLLPIKVRDFLSLAALRIFSLSLEYVSFAIKCWGIEWCLLILGGDLSISWIWMPVSFPRLGKFSAMIFSNTLSGSLSFLAPSGTPFKRRFFFLRLSFISLNLSSWSFNCLFFPQFPSLPSACLLCHSLVPPPC